MKDKNFIGTCVNNPFSSLTKLCEIIDNSKKITLKTFKKHCNLQIDLLNDFKTFPRDYRFFKNKDIYYYTWSMIEHFYK